MVAELFEAAASPNNGLIEMRREEQTRKASNIFRIQNIWGKLSEQKTWRKSGMTFPILMELICSGWLLSSRRRWV